MSKAANKHIRRVAGSRNRYRRDWRCLARHQSKGTGYSTHAIIGSPKSIRAIWRIIFRDKVSTTQEEWRLGMIVSTMATPGATIIVTAIHTQTIGYKQPSI